MSAAKVLYGKTVSSRVVRHSLAYLSVHKWLVEDNILYLNILVKKTYHPL